MKAYKIVLLISLLRGVSKAFCVPLRILRLRVTSLSIFCTALCMHSHGDRGNEQIFTVDASGNCFISSSRYLLHAIHVLHDK